MSRYIILQPTDLKKKKKQPKKENDQGQVGIEKDLRECHLL